MNFDLSDEQALFRDTVARFAGGIDSAGRRTLRSAPGGYNRQRWHELADLGLIALAAGEAHGGLNGSHVDWAVVGEALGMAIAPDPWIENALVPVRLLDRAGDAASLARVLSGEWLVAPALFERAARYDLRPAETRARGEGNGFVLNGAKTFVPGGAMADRLIVSADLGGEVAFFLVSADSAGIERRGYRVADGSFAAELRLDAVPGERLDLGLPDLVDVVAEARLCSAAELLGLAQRAFDDTLDYVRQREQFGAPIGSFQALQHRLVDCYARLEQSRSMLWRAALAEPEERIRSAAGARVFVGENAAHVAREAVQMHGGMGITEDLAIGHALKRILMLGVLFGDNDTTLNDYAEAA